MRGDLGKFRLALPASTTRSSGMTLALPKQRIALALACLARILSTQTYNLPKFLISYIFYFLKFSEYNQN